jgi:hypothetical protein
VHADPAGHIEETVVDERTDVWQGTSISWTGSEFGLAWMKSTTDRSTVNILFARLDVVGEILLGPVSVTEDIHAYTFVPYLEWTGSEFGMAFGVEGGENDYVSFRSISHDGTISDSSVRIYKEFSGTPYASDLVWSGSEYGILWEDMPEDVGQVFFQRIGLCD